MPKILVTEENLEDIIMMIKTWEDKLTWDLLCSKVSELLNVKSIERQSLANYPDIQEAFSKQKQKIKEKAKANPDPNVTMDYLQKLRYNDWKKSMSDISNNLLYGNIMHICME